MTANRQNVQKSVSLLLLAAVALGFGVFQGPWLQAQEPERGAQVDPAEGVRRLIKELETRAEAQRAQLRKTEATLQKAKALLADLAEAADDPRLAELRRQESELTEKLVRVRRLVRSADDPTLRSAMRRLELVRDEIEKLEGR